MWPITLIRLCSLRADPQDLPISMPLTLFAVALYLIADVASCLQMVETIPALEAAALDTLLLLGLTQAGLNWRHQGRRLRQTVMALTGTGAIMTAIAVGLEMLFPGIVNKGILGWLFLVWMFAVYGHIVRHAFDVSYAGGIGLTGVYFVGMLIITAPLLSPQS